MSLSDSTEAVEKTEHLKVDAEDGKGNLRFFGPRSASSEISVAPVVDETEIVVSNSFVSF